MTELHKYLRITNCQLNVDNFDFEPLIHCLAEYAIESSIVHKPDISEGVEKMVVPIVNHYDNTMPPPCVYSAQRIPTEGGNILFIETRKKKIIKTIHFRSQLQFG